MPDFPDIARRYEAEVATLRRELALHDMIVGRGPPANEGGTAPTHRPLEPVELEDLQGCVGRFVDTGDEDDVPLVSVRSIRATFSMLREMLLEARRETQQVRQQMQQQMQQQAQQQAQQQQKQQQSDVVMKELKQGAETKVVRVPTTDGDGSSPAAPQQQKPGDGGTSTVAMAAAAVAETAGGAAPAGATGLVPPMPPGSAAAVAGVGAVAGGGGRAAAFKTFQQGPGKDLAQALRAAKTESGRPECRLRHVRARAPGKGVQTAHKNTRTKNFSSQLSNVLV